MALDIDTPKGRETVMQSRAAIAAFEKSFPKLMYVQTPEISEAANDGLVVGREDKTVRAVVEVKCRGATLEQFDFWNWKWLVTADKVRRCAFIARELRVNFAGFCYLVPSRILLVKTLYDGSVDKWRVDLDTRNSETQRTVNGGTTTRENAYLDMRDAFQVRVP